VGAAESATKHDDAHDVKGAAPLLEPGKLLVLGEMHGSDEFPATLADLARQGAAIGPVNVYLELPEAEQHVVDDLVAGQGAKTPPAAGAWARAYQDGRSSAAMWKLLVSLTDLARETKRVHVHLIDVPETSHPDKEFARKRDRSMADVVIGSVHAHPAELHLALVGNAHSRLKFGVPWDPQYAPFAYLVKEGGVPVTSVLGTYSTGSIWSCESPELSSCGVHGVKGSIPDTGTERKIELAAGVEGGHLGTAYVGALHASPPALAKTEGAHAELR
jgi:hypothetical protein